MLENKILIYDDHCPLCTWYSGLFIKYGFLNEDGRKPFSNLEPVYFNRIDPNKSRNEIPLLDIASGKVEYGIDSLLTILGQKFPLIKKTGNIKPVKWFLLKFYKLVSYNRKVIVAKKCGPGLIDCAPDFNYFYRIIFMIVFLLFNTIMLYFLYNFVFAKLDFFAASNYKLQAAHFSLAFINCALAMTLSTQKRIEYLGQVNMLAVIAILLLSPLLLLQYLVLNTLFITIYLIVVALVVIKEYIRRMQYADVLLNNKWIVSLNLVSIGGFLLLLFH
jgi:hypothetical protein